MNEGIASPDFALGIPPGTGPTLTAAHAGLQARRWLGRAAAAWAAVAAMGLLAFAFYVAMAYGRPLLTGNTAAWTKLLPVGFKPGDAMGNAALVAHLLLAIVVTVGGVLQLVPVLRTRAPALHRWNGRLFMVAALVAAGSGIYMVWTRGTVGDLSQHVAITLNGVVMALCAAMAWRHALQRRFDLHRRWAIRLVLAANGVWFFRIGLMLWLLVFQRPVGFDPQRFAGPFLTVLAFAQFVVPLAVFELYDRASRSASPAARRAMAVLLAGLTLATAAGIFGAVMGLWLPRMGLLGR